MLHSPQGMSAAPSPIAQNADIRYLGRLLGDVIRAFGGQQLFERIEAIRASSVQVHRGLAGEAALGQNLGALGPDEQLDFVRRTQRSPGESWQVPPATIPRRAASDRSDGIGRSARGPGAGGTRPFMPAARPRPTKRSASSDAPWPPSAAASGPRAALDAERRAH